MTRLAEYADARELTLNLTLRELAGRYKRSVLGWTWSLLNPLSTVVIFSIVFAFFLKVEPPVGDPSGLHNFAMFLLCGLLAVELPVERHERVHGLAARQQQPHQEGVLPPRGARRLDDRRRCSSRS